jgi:outer membrane protein OmpA-like peptidoglycan-associated protein
VFTISLTAQVNDSVTQNNKLLIEQLKNRINAIDNSETSVNQYKKEIASLKLELLTKIDSIKKLNQLIADLKKNDTEIETIKGRKMSDLEYNLKYQNDPSYLKYQTACNCKTIFYMSAQTELNFDELSEIKNLVKELKMNPSKKITLVGHASQPGNDDNNILLSKQRAELLKQFLVSTKTISSKNITIEWHGSSQPIQGLASEKQFLNRRVEIKLN